MYVECAVGEWTFPLSFIHPPTHPLLPSIQVLKRKKMYEQQRDQLAAQSFNVDQTNFALESVKVLVTHPPTHTSQLAHFPAGEFLHPYTYSREATTAHYSNHPPIHPPPPTKQDTITTVDAMKGAHKALKAEVKKVKIDDIEVRQTTHPSTRELLPTHASSFLFPPTHPHSQHIQHRIRTACASSIHPPTHPPTLGSHR